MKQPTVLDLFCGCGGMSLGLHKAGFRLLAGIDSWGQALRTFELNHPAAVTIEADVTELDPAHVMDRLALSQGAVDCIVGGPPCQGFSKNVPAAYRFLEDPRNQLFRDFLRFVEALTPQVVVMENVPTIYNAYSGSVRREIVDTLHTYGYETKVAVLYAPDYGVPQSRRRCFFLASTTGAPQFPRARFAQKETNTLFGALKNYRSAWSAISDLPILHNGEGYEPMPYDKDPQNEYQRKMRDGSRMLYDHIAKELTNRQMARVTALAPGEDIRHLPDDIRPKSGYSGAYGRLDFEMLAPTITRWVFHTGSGRFTHPREDRLITIREAARLQSFYDDFRFTGSYNEKAHQVGNAVPPLLMEALAEEIRSLCD